MRVPSAGLRRPLFPCLKAGVSSPVDFTIRPKVFRGAEALVVASAGTAQWVKPWSAWCRGAGNAGHRCGGNPGGSDLVGGGGGRRVCRTILLAVKRAARVGAMFKSLLTAGRGERVASSFFWQMMIVLRWRRMWASTACQESVGKLLESDGCLTQQLLDIVCALDIRGFLRAFRLLDPCIRIRLPRFDSTPSSQS